jgi:hypothetical protein
VWQELEEALGLEAATEFILASNRCDEQTQSLSIMCSWRRNSGNLLMGEMMKIGACALA